MNTNFEHYRIFYYVAKYENLTKAASVLKTSQPAVTRTIHNLENDLGCRLFIRSKKGMQRENGETGFTLEHTLGDYEQETRMVEYADLREALRRLPERERQVIALRFYHGLTQQRAAELLHISQVQVSRLERRAVERMRVWLDA